MFENCKELTSYLSKIKKDGSSHRAIDPNYMVNDLLLAQNNPQENVICLFYEII